LTDKLEEVRQLSRWIIENLSDAVPTHFVRFHPSYKYTHVERTPIAFLEQARDAARQEGLKNVYIGNTMVRGHGDVLCPVCGNLLVERFGLHSTVKGITEGGRCSDCGKEVNIPLLPGQGNSKPAATDMSKNNTAEWVWADINRNSIHLQVHNSDDRPVALICNHLDAHGDMVKQEYMDIPKNCSIRVTFGKTSEQDVKIEIIFSQKLTFKIFELEDRAHFPLKADQAHV